jgi:L-asparaginase/Glu-tRNA(Gln) amidotransferase subunit D
VASPQSPNPETQQLGVRSTAAQEPSVLVLYAGGTFGMKSGRESSLESNDCNVMSQPLQNVSLEALEQKLRQETDSYFGCRHAATDACRGEQHGLCWRLAYLTDDQGVELGPMDSSAVRPYHWHCLAQTIQRNYADYQGFVVIHGTDTLAYTAAALSFLLQNLDKPVVLTGSQLPIFESRNDARLNFLNAMSVAGHFWSGLPSIPEVVVAFGDSLLRGNRCQKSTTRGWQGFVSPNFPPLGQLTEPVRIHHVYGIPGERSLESGLQGRSRGFLQPSRSTEPNGGLVVERHWDDRVLALTLFPGIRASQLQLLLNEPDLKGLLLRCYGSGNAPDDPELITQLKLAHQRGVAIVVVSQCSEGQVDLGRYAAGASLAEFGAISGFDLTPEAALTKMMWLLGKFPDQPEEFRNWFQRDSCGEQSLSLISLAFNSEGILFIDADSLPGSCHLERCSLRIVTRANCSTTVNVDIREFSGSEASAFVGQLSVELPKNGMGLLNLTRWIAKPVFELSQAVGQSLRIQVSFKDRPPSDCTTHLELYCSSF